MGNRHTFSFTCNNCYSKHKYNTKALKQTKYIEYSKILRTDNICFECHKMDKVERLKYHKESLEELERKEREYRKWQNDRIKNKRMMILTYHGGAMIYYVDK